MDKKPVNILLIGKTGVGKSAFINYFIGKDVAESASGMPVTQQMKEYSFEIGGYPLSIFDTKGLETLEVNSQVNELKTEITKRNNGDDIYNWFHTIFYCISMANARFEDFEIDFIKCLSTEISQHIHIILTNCDACQPSAVDEMRQKIKKDLSAQNNIRIFDVISVDKKKRNGTVISKRGKEKVTESVFELLWDDISKKIAKEYSREFNNSIRGLIDSFCSDLNSMIDDTVKIKTLISLIKDEEKASKELNDKVDILDDQFDRVIKKEDEKYHSIVLPLLEFAAAYKGILVNDVNCSNLDFNTVASDFFPDKLFDEMFDVNKITEILPHIGMMDEEEMNKKCESQSILENVFYIGKLISDAGKDIVLLKSNLKKYVKKCKNDILDKIPSQEAVEQHIYDKTKALIEALE